jgi:AhpD family alkylhydroperoxidase
MTRVQIHDTDSAPEGSRDGLKALHAKYGTTLNIFGAMANAPTVLGAFLAFEGTVAETTSLDRKAREAIHLTVANVNECDYCQGAYTMAATGAGFDDEEAKAIRRGALPDDERLTALLALAREIATRKGHVDDTAWKTALEAGWSEQQLLEAFADTVRTIFTNYFNHLVDTEQDVPEAPAL